MLRYLFIVISQVIAIPVVGFAASIYVTPEMFGAIGDGRCDDSYALYQAMQSPYDLILRNDYLVSKTPLTKAALYQVPSHKRIYGGGRILTTSSKGLFIVHSSCDVTIENITLDFNNVIVETQHSSSNHGVVIVNSSDITIKNVKIISPRGDGIYIGSYNNEENHNHNVVIRDVQVCDFGRQGIAVIEGDDIVIEDCQLTNTETCLYGGIDIEPNHAYEAVGIRVNNNTLINCGINTYRAHSQLRRNNKIVIKGNKIKKQLHLVGGVGSHYCGIAIQDAISAVVTDNEVEGFIGISAYNCDKCEIRRNQIHSSFRGIRAYTIKDLLLKDNIIEKEEEFDFSSDKEKNPEIIQEMRTTIELVSSDGDVFNNFFNGRIWARDCSKIKVEKNTCKGSNGAILLNLNRKGSIVVNAIVKRNVCESKGDYYPIMILEGDNSITFEISKNRYLKTSKGIYSPKIGKGCYVKRNVMIENN